MASSSTVWDILPNQLPHPSIQSTDPFWNHYQHNTQGTTIHIAILSKAYLDLILNHDKTIESRFSINRRIPYERVKKGDIILLKGSGGPIVGIGYVSDVEFVDFSDGTSWAMIKEKYGEGLRIQDEAFWDRYSKSSYGTFIQLDHVRHIEPMSFSKRDRNAWVIFEPNEDR